ncbi:chromosome segregation protein SMC [Kocuria palustris]|nr:chromosome segregation protein SMC [Kocuria palustris]
MRVEELIIDGFKLYATRTVISGWDAQFNAITGLNGLGKLNILDAICFVLGILLMTTVRALNLQDLIYKRGQAGVTKASVTIVFNNEDKQKLPIGFEQYNTISVTRQILLGGQSKYMINGHKALQQTVLSLFQLIQLNINNPNFLIMQGKITKVLNLKPKEILLLVEEAAGTRTFEDRKDKAQKTLERKEGKIAEIQLLLAEEIEPKLEKLKGDKRLYMEYQQTQIDLERLSRIVVAYDYDHLRSDYVDVSLAKAELESKIVALEEINVRVGDEITSLSADLEAARESRKSEADTDGKIAHLEERETELNNVVTRQTTARDLAADLLREEMLTRDRLREQVNNAELGSDITLVRYTQLEQTYAEATAKVTELKLAYARKEDLVLTLLTGVSALGQVQGGYERQLADAKDQLNRDQIFIKQLTVKIESLKRQMTQNLAQIEQARAEHAALVAQQSQYDSVINNLESQLQQKLGFDPERLVSLKQNHHELTLQQNRLESQMNQMRPDVGNIDFQYNRPHANFNDHQVRGIVAQLFDLPENQFDKALALQVCAGARLYNVVVDTANVASDLLNRGGLRRRVTMLPLDKIISRTIDSSVVEYAKAKAPGKVELALNLIQYKGEYRKAMEYVFGTTFICADPATAKAITFDPKIRARSITLEGDVYDPEGNLSGGSRRTNSLILIKLQRYNLVAREHRELQLQSRKLESELGLMEQKMASTKGLANEIKTKRYELELLQKKQATHSSLHLLSQQEQHQNQISELEREIGERTIAISKLEANIEEIERDMQEFDSDKGSKIKQLQRELKELATELQNKQSQLDEILDEFQLMQVDREQRGNEVANLVNQIEQCNATIAELEAKQVTIAQEVTDAEAALSRVRQQLEEEKAVLLGLDEEINELQRVLKDKQAQHSEALLQSQQLGHELEKIEARAKTSQVRLEEIINQHMWINEEGAVEAVLAQNPNVDLAELRELLKVLEERFESMRRKVNPNIMSMIENVEKKEQSLKQMVKTITKDKAKIIKTVEKLNGFKRDTLNQTYQKVSTDFGEIFSEVLPGAFAKLVPVDMMDVTKGLEVKVRLGDKWKDSLVELSGGQRSLIALSLIMALLQFKPAPMYILDEVDAALDLSHTQLIGMLIKNRFRTAQFIVVSLKEGMFNNANTVFRARFQEGTSKVIKM